MTDPSPPPQRFMLRRPEFWTTGLVALVTVLGVVGFTVMSGVVGAFQAGEPISRLVSPILMFLVCFLGVAAAVGFRAWVRNHPMPAVVLHEDGVDLPGHPEAIRPTRVPYNTLLSVGLAGRPGATVLLVETRESAFLVPIDLFVDEAGPQSLTEELNRRVESLPESSSLQELARQRRELVERVVSVRTIATQALLGLLVVMFANQLLSGSLESLFGLVRWGANVPVLVHGGEAFRMVTANFLHAHAPHILLNGVALYFLGRLMERVLGTVRFLLVFLIAGLAANFTTAYLSGYLIPSSGASGAIFGLLGALAWVNWRFRGELPLGIRQPRRVWILIAVINLALIPVLFLLGLGRVDMFAHVGGLIAGAAVCAHLVRRGLDVGKPPSSYARAAALALGLLYVGGMVEGLVYAAEFDDERREAVAQSMLANLDADAESLNELAWYLAIDPRTAELTLVRAEAAARRAVELRPDEPSFRDTLATALYRRDLLVEAAAEERRAFALRADAHTASQLARFLTPHFDRDGPVLPAGVHDVSLAFSGENEAGEPENLRLAVGSSLPDGGTVIATLRRGEKQLGLLHVELGRHPTSEHEFPIGDGVGESLAGKRIRLDIVLVDATPVSEVPKGDVRWSLWDHDPRVDAYP